MINFRPGKFPAGFVIVLVCCFVTATVAAYEGKPVPHISEILQPRQAQSVYHRVQEVQLVDRDYQFYVETEFAGYNIQSLPLLRDSIREILILGDAISQFARENQAFSDELRSFLEIRADSVIDIISRPVESATNLAGQAVTNLDETFSGPQYNERKTYVLRGQDSADPTFSMHKRNVASQWNLDVYSINPKVQEFLNAVARKRGAGTISAGAPSLDLSRGSRTQMENSTIELAVKSSLKRNDIDSLYLTNHAMLTGLNVQSGIRDSFLQHPWYSPSYQTRIIHYLASVEDLRNLTAFFTHALDARSVSDARGVVEIAMQLAWYNAKTGKLLQLNRLSGLLQAVTADNKLLFFPQGDVLYWNRETHEMLAEFRQRASSAGFSSARLITSGRVTPLASKEMHKLGFEIYDGYGL